MSQRSFVLSSPRSTSLCPTIQRGGPEAKTVLQLNNNKYIKWITLALMIFPYCIFIYQHYYSDPEMFKLGYKRDRSYVPQVLCFSQAMFVFVPNWEAPYAPQVICSPLRLGLGLGIGFGLKGTTLQITLWWWHHGAICNVNPVIWLLFVLWRLYYFHKTLLSPKVYLWHSSILKMGGFTF